MNLFPIVKIIVRNTVSISNPCLINTFHRRYKWRADSQSFTKWTIPGCHVTKTLYGVPLINSLVKKCIVTHHKPSALVVRFYSTEEPENEKLSTRFTKRLSPVLKGAAFVMIGIPLFGIGGFVFSAMCFMIGMGLTQGLCLLIHEPQVFLDPHELHYKMAYHDNFLAGLMGMFCGMSAASAYAIMVPSLFSGGK